jgi:hypothetical protein
MKGRISIDQERLEHLPEGPLKMGKRILWWIRKTVFTKEKPPNPAVFVTRSERQLVELLGSEHFEPGWEFSYSYRGEVLNLRRVEFVSDHPLGYEWWQVHVRGYEAGENEFELAAHFELEPSEYPSLHVDRVGLDVDRGNAILIDLLDKHGVEYEYRLPDSTPEARVRDTADSGTSAA